jgi:hypothetical protein
MAAHGAGGPAVWNAIALMVGAGDTVVAAASLLPSCLHE